jgi:hypothetical protein
MTLRERLELMVEFGPRLRVAGYQSFELEGIRAVLTPPDAPEPKPEKTEAEPSSPLNDPDTYGSSGKVPGFERPSDLPVRGQR